MVIRSYRASILALLTTVMLSAQAYGFGNVITRDGLTNSAVLSIIKDRDGRVGFGTCDGLNAYDDVRAWKVEGWGDYRTDAAAKECSSQMSLSDKITVESHS